MSAPVHEGLKSNSMYTVLQSKRANFVVFKIFCYIHKSIQEGSILSLWKGQQALVQLCGKLHVVM